MRMLWALSRTNSRIKAAKRKRGGFFEEESYTCEIIDLCKRLQRKDPMDRDEAFGCAKGT